MEADVVDDTIQLSLEINRYKTLAKQKKNLRPERSLLDMRSTLNNIMVVKNTPHLEPCEKFVPPREVMKAAKAATQDYNNMHKSTK